MMWLQGIALTLVIVLARCQNVARLHFNASGQFKIAQFADLHFGEAENTLWGPQQDINSTRVMNRVLAWEVPDLVIYTGGTNLPEALVFWTSERCVP